MKEADFAKLKTYISTSENQLNHLIPKMLLDMIHVYMLSSPLCLGEAIQQFLEKQTGVWKPSVMWNNSLLCFPTEKILKILLYKKEFSTWLGKNKDIT